MTYHQNLKSIVCHYLRIIIYEYRLLMLENQRLESELKRLQYTKWSVAKIKDDDGMTKFYTGLPNLAVFLWLFKYDLKLVTSICLNVDKVKHFTTTFRSNDMNFEQI